MVIKKLYDKENETIKWMIEESQMTQIETQLKNQTVTSSVVFLILVLPTQFVPITCILRTLSLFPLLSSYLVSMWMENFGRKEHCRKKKNKSRCTMVSWLEAETSAWRCLAQIKSQRMTSETNWLCVWFLFVVILTMLLCRFSLHAPACFVQTHSLSLLNYDADHQL